MKSTNYNIVIAILSIILLGMIIWFIYPDYIKPNFRIEDKITEVQNNLEEEKKAEETKKEKEISPLPEYTEPLVIKKSDEIFTGIADFDYNLIYYKNGKVYEKDLETNQDTELFSIPKTEEMERGTEIVHETSLSPDEKKIAFSDENEFLKIYDRETKEINILNQNVQDFKVSNIQWAYNSQYISTNLTDESGNIKIGIVNLETGEYQFLDVYADSAYYGLLLAWHPFKLEFTYWGEDEKVIKQAIIQDDIVTGKKDLPVNIGLNDEDFFGIRDILYSPDGDKTIYIYSAGGEYIYDDNKIILMNSDGTEARYLEEFQGKNTEEETLEINDITFGADSKEILVVYSNLFDRTVKDMYEDSSYKIYKYNWQTKEKQEYMNVEGYMNGKIIKNIDNKFLILEIDKNIIDQGLTLGGSSSKLNIKLIDLEDRKDYTLYMENKVKTGSFIPSYTIGLAKK